jgi:hypothetical protein
VFDEKTVRLKIIAQHGGESRLVFDHQDPWLVETRCDATPHKDPPITQINEVDQANILLWVNPFLIPISFLQVPINRAVRAKQEAASGLFSHYGGTRTTTAGSGALPALVGYTTDGQAIAAIERLR